MSSSVFRIQEHSLPTCHIREYSRATASGQDDVLQLAIKEYVPRVQIDSPKTTVTIIGAHANGFPKELYEPLWEELYERLKAKRISIRGIWIADVAAQGASGILNEEQLGNDPHWHDHPRDLFIMVNHFRDRIRRPIIGIGHSMGGNNLVNLSLMHPRLFTTLVLVDPVINRHVSVNKTDNPAKASTRRRDIWPSRKDAAEKMLKSKFYQAWDPRVFDRWIRYGLRDLPTKIHPQFKPVSSTPPTITPDTSLTSITPDKDTERPVTLATTKHQEVLSFMRAHFPTEEFPNPEIEYNHDTHPDIYIDRGLFTPFTRPEQVLMDRLPFIRPSVFYIFGDPVLADMSSPIQKADRLANTGIGAGGSGGFEKGRVSSVTFDGIGHLIPMEVVGRTADAATSWIAPEIARWQANEDKGQRLWAAVPDDEKSIMSQEYVKRMQGDWRVDSAVEAGKMSKL